jgi:hypothetical protein
MCFFKLAGEAYFEQIPFISILKNSSCCRYFIQNLHTISQGNNVLDNPPCNIDGFLGEKHVFLQISRKGLYGTKRAYLHIGKPQFARVFFLKSNSILTG